MVLKLKPFLKPMWIELTLTWARPVLLALIALAMAIALLLDSSFPPRALILASAGLLLPIDRRLQASARKKRGSQFQPLEPTTLGWFWLILFSLALFVLGSLLWDGNLLLAAFALPFVPLLYRQARKNMRPVGLGSRHRQKRARKPGKAFPT